MSDTSVTNVQSGIAVNPEKTKETLQNEEEAMAAVFQNDPDANMRKEQGTRMVNPPDRRQKEAEEKGPSLDAQPSQGMRNQTEEQANVGPAE